MAWRCLGDLGDLGEADEVRRTWLPSSGSNAKIIAFLPQSTR
jgi:hypothetical protein